MTIIIIGVLLNQSDIDAPKGILILNDILKSFHYELMNIIKLVIHI